MILFVSQESGWGFHSIKNFDCRYVITAPVNNLALGRANKKLVFHPLLQKLFFRSVFDPAEFLRAGYNKDNFCVLAAIIMAFHSKFGPSINRVSIHTIESEMVHLNFKGLYRFSHKGLKLTDLKKLEAMNEPLADGLLELFPPLALFKGIALNLFCIKRQGDEFRIFPLSLSENSRESSYFQVDLIRLTPDLLMTEESVSLKKPFGPRRPAPQGSPEDHVLYVPYLARLMTKFSHLRLNACKYTFLCRSCCHTYKSSIALHNHYSTCPSNSRKGSATARKRSKNVYLHMPRRFNTFTNRQVQNGMTFQRSQNHRMLKPLLIGFADLEAYQSKNLYGDSAFHKPSKLAISSQLPMGYAYTYRSLYDDIPLPQSLALPRIRFCTQNQDCGDAELFISFFISLRNDLIHISNHLKSVLAKDTPPIPKAQRNKKLIALFNQSKECNFCGKKFFQKSYSAISKKFYRVLPNYDHDHYNSKKFPLLASGLRAVLCQGNSCFVSSMTFVF